MAQGGAHIPVAPGAPAKPSTAKAAVPARAPSSGTMGIARPQSPAAPVAAKPAAPAAPKAQPRPAPVPAPAVKPVVVVVAKAVAVAPAKPVAVAPAASAQKPAPTAVENMDAMDTRVGPRPVAPVKPLQQAPLQSQQDLVVRALIDASMAPLEQKLRDLQRRIEELELRPPPALAAAPTLGYATAHAVGHLATRAPVLDIATIERTVQLGPEAASFDGTRRRRKLFVATFVAIVVVFGGLFAALAQSYAHAHG